MRFSLLLLIAIIFLPYNFSAQNAKKLLEMYSKKYPDSRYIVLDKTETVSVDMVDGKILITEKSSEENFYLDEDAGYLSEDKIPFSSFSKISDVEAISYLPKGSRFKSKKVTDFKVQDEFSRGIFHDDAKSMKFEYSGLQKGSKTSLSYTKTVNQPRFLNGFYFIAPVPTLKQQYILEVDPAIEIEIENFNLDNFDIQFSESKNKAGKKTYTWTLKDAPKFEIEAQAPTVRYYAPHVIPRITHFTVNGKQQKLLAEVEDLFAWYNSLVSKVNTEVDEAEMKKVVNEITKNAKTDLEKVKQIYNWTQKNIKYIAFEEGMNGFIPRNTDQVINQKYGDCKDMSTCISTLLKYAEVPASVCWIGTDDIPYTYKELPTPAVDNHMIAAYKGKDQYYFLDATSEYTRFGMPSSFIQGKEAMVKTGANEFELVKVPVVEAQKNSLIEHSKIKIVGDKLIGNATTNIDGYLKTNLTYQLLDADKEQQFKYFSNFLKRGSNKFILDNFEIDNKDNIDKSTNLTYSFNIADYIFENKDEMYVNLNFYEWLQGNKIKEERKIPLRRKFKRFRKVTNEFEIPTNYTVEFVPKDLVLENDQFTFISKYEITANKIIHKEEVIENYLLLEPKYFKRYNKFIEAIDESNNQTIILKKK